jgi:hypothetical protein
MTPSECQKFYDQHKNEGIQLNFYGETAWITLHDLVLMARHVKIEVERDPIIEEEGPCL